MARTMLSPMCWATSRVSVRLPSPSLAVVEVDVDVQGVVELRHRVDGELDVDDGAGDAGDPADAGRGLGRCSHGRSSLLCGCGRSASAPPTISLISWVISA